MNDLDLNELVEDIPTTLLAGFLSSRIKGNHLYLEVKKDSLPGFASHMHKKYHAWLVSEHAVDRRGISDDYGIFAVFSLPRGNRFVTLFTSVDQALTTYRSITPEIYAADWFEREMMDMFGLFPTGHPDLRPLFLYDDWPPGHYPLRKDFGQLEAVPRVPCKYVFRHVDGEGIFEVPVGPIHAGVIEPGHFRFSVAGEPIINLEVRLGYTHRGVEKLSESMPYHKGAFLSERISGDNGYSHSLAYCQALESMARMEVSPRAEYLRTIYSEMERLYNHFGDVGGVAMDTAFTVGAQMAYVLRERVLDLNEQATGSRLLRSVNQLGGVRKDIDNDLKAIINGTLVRIKLDFNDFVSAVTQLPSLLDRVETTGILSHDSARNLNVVGPVGRASGIDRDSRRDHPYAAYPELSFTIPVYREGDVLARLRVKIDEVFESISIIEQALDKMPSGEVVRPVPDIPSGEIGMSLVETHRGEAMHWLLSGAGMPYRHKVRDASFLNWPAIEMAVMGNIVPDFPLINKSFNLSYAGNDL
jgi:Ni,Fe-hydrogenase III large subunit/Ni,Fe-hydrogenase III component G